MLVNCEKTSTRWPSFELVAERVSSSASSFAESRTPRAALIATSRGSQHTCRSFVSASRMVTADAATPLARMARRTSPCAATRMAS